MTTIIGGRRTNDFVSSITVSLPIDVIQTLNSLSEEHRVSRSAIVSQAIEQFLQDLKTTQDNQEVKESTK